ncbi:hypothetical protein XH79_07570 [Bradyrhizobium sp. CCBAU 45389]|nr:hypothetical protein [Bradyrhizobium sp. CCBAU 45389]
MGLVNHLHEVNQRNTATPLSRRMFSMIATAAPLVGLEGITITQSEVVKRGNPVKAGHLHCSPVGSGKPICSSSPFALDFVADPLAVFLGRGFAEVIYYEQTLAMRLG